MICNQKEFKSMILAVYKCSRWYVYSDASTVMVKFEFPVQTTNMQGVPNKNDRVPIDITQEILGLENQFTYCWKLRICSYFFSG